MSNRPENPPSDAKSNSSRISGTNAYKGSADAAGVGPYGGPIQKLPNRNPSSAKPPEKSPLFNGTELMSFTTMLETLEEISYGLGSNVDYASGDPLNQEIDSIPETMGAESTNDEELLECLNQIFTPILVMQGIEGDISDRINEAVSEDNVLYERNMIKFDDSSRMAQLTSICALLIARQKGSQQYKMYKEAAKIRNAMKLAIQKAEYESAQNLAQKYLVKVSTTTGSSVARKAAQNLLPQTQH